MSDADAAEAKRRAEWLHQHKAHKDWIILSVSEVAVIRAELEAAERERDEYKQERDEAREALMKIEDLFIDGSDIYADREKMGTIARNALGEAK